MSGGTALKERISRCYGELPTQLQRSAQYVMDYPLQVATRSMRTVASESDISPASFSRLARVLGYNDFEELREECRETVGHNRVSFSDRAELIQARNQSKHKSELIFEHAATSVQNIEQSINNIDVEALNDAADLLYNARKVILIGSLSSAGFATHFGYIANWLSDKWTVINGSSQKIASSLMGLGPEDAVLVVTKSPHAQRSIAALEFARKRGAKSIVITDTIASPALEYAQFPIIVRTEGPVFFSSYVATLVVLETLLSMLVLRGGEAIRKRIASIEETNRQIGEYQIGKI